MLLGLVKSRLSSKLMAAIAKKGRESERCGGNAGRAAKAAGKIAKDWRIRIIICRLQTQGHTQRDTHSKAHTHSQRLAHTQRCQPPFVCLSSACQWQQPKWAKKPAKTLLTQPDPLPRAVPSSSLSLFPTSLSLSLSQTSRENCVKNSNRFGVGSSLAHLLAGYVRHNLSPVRSFGQQCSATMRWLRALRRREE